MTPDQLAQKLQRADAAYAGGTPVCTDQQYDRARARLADMHPDHPYLRTITEDAVEIPAARKEPLPFVVGSLSKLRPDAVAPWMRQTEKICGRQRGWLVLPKFDGQSVTLSYESGDLVKAWTRGKVVEGQSVGQRVTENAKMVQGVLRRLRTCDTFDGLQGQYCVRGEVIMHQSIWREHYLGKPDVHGRTWSNPRNMCAGLLGRLDHAGARPDLARCTFVALQLFRKTASGRWLRPPSAHQEWVMLQLLGFTTAVNPTRWTPGNAKIARMVRADGHDCLRSVLPVHDPVAGIGQLAYWDHHPTAQEVTERLAAMRTAVDIRLDGLVVMPIDIGAFVKRDEHLAMRPAFMQSIKAEAHDQDTIDGHIRAIEWRVSKRGLLKPRLTLREPLDFDGVEVTYATANNAANVQKWGLRAGRPIRMIRSGDVIPRPVAVYNGSAAGWVPLTVEKTKTRRDGTSVTVRVDGPGIRDAKIQATLPTQCPDCATRLQWNGSRVDLWCSNEDCPGRHHKQVVTFFKILGVENVAKGVITDLIASGLHTIPDILDKCTPAYVQRLEGYQARSAKIVSEAIQGALRGAHLAKIMHASGAFGDEQSSLGSTKLRDVLDATGPGMIERATDAQLRSKLKELRGLGPSGLRLLLDGLPEWRALWKQIQHHHAASEGPQTLDGLVVAFTGFRSTELQTFIEQHGGRVAGLSRKTNVLFSVGDVSGKTRKADELQIPIVGQLQAWDWLRKRAGE